MALAVRRSQVLGRRQSWVVLAATVVMLAGMLIPATGGAYQFSFGMMGVTWMLGYHALSGASGLAGRSSGAAAPEPQSRGRPSFGTGTSTPDFPIGQERKVSLRSGKADVERAVALGIDCSLVESAVEQLRQQR